MTFVPPNGIVVSVWVQRRLTPYATAPLEPRQNACFVVGKDALPAEVQDSVTAIQSAVTCGSGTTIDNVPDVTSGSATFSKIDFSKSSSSPLQFALDTFATPADPATADLATLQDQLNTYLATEAGLRSVGGSLAIKVPKFFLAMQVSRVQTAQVCCVLFPLSCFSLHTYMRVIGRALFAWEPLLTRNRATRLLLRVSKSIISGTRS